MLVYTRQENKRVQLVKDLTSDQTWRDISVRFQAGNIAFDGSNGLGYDAEASSFFIIHAAGFPDQRITASLKYSSATTQGSEDIGVVARFQTLEGSDDTYYYARIVSGLAAINRVVDGAFTTLDSAAFSLAQDAWVDITLQCVGTSITATFNAGGSPSTVNLSATDSAIPQRGITGVLSLTSSIFCRNFTVEQL